MRCRKGWIVEDKDKIMKDKNTNMEADLLPCPWCGNAPEATTYEKGEFWDGPAYIIHCVDQQCAYAHPESSTNDSSWSLAINAWNTRGGKLGCEQPPEVAARLEWLDEMQETIWYHCKNMEEMKKRFDGGFM